MKNPDFTGTFILQTDVSEVGIGAVLSQGEENDHLLPILAESSYHMRELILLSRRNVR